jgi:hypothetical protein
MRIISLILGIYLILLTGIACADDTSDSSMDTGSVIVQTNDHNHSHNQHGNEDGCSPLCYCNCCHTQLNFTTTVIMEVQEKHRPAYYVYQENAKSLDFFELLHPPKI